MKKKKKRGFWGQPQEKKNLVYQKKKKTKKKTRGFKGKWAISAEVHYSSSTAGLLLPLFFFFFSLLYISSSFSLIFKFQGAFSLNERQIHMYFFLLSLSLYLRYACIFFFCTLKWLHQDNNLCSYWLPLKHLLLIIIK